jgi:hypothetical protein
MDPNKIQNPQNSVKFLGIIWMVTGPKVPNPVLDKTANLKAPTNKTEVQQTIGLFGYWRNHIPYLQILLHLYQVIRKASDFEWGPQQEHAFKVKELITTHSQLYTIARTDTVILDISYQAGYGNWSVMCKQGARTVPILFYCKRFPYVESKYTIFERLTWMLIEAVKTVCLVLMDQCLIIHSPVPILHWINMEGEALAGTPSEPKVLQWKWFLSEFLNNHKIRAKGKMPLRVEETASGSMVPCSITMSKITQAKNIGC